ncbi:MAG: OmpA family protein [Gemmatimonadetes bacterium]|nr:OmpA family protein [Gemmatimonadota bacterium]
MSNSRLVLAALATVLVVGACAPEPPPEPPAPTGPTAEELERMRQDSIRRAEEAAAAERDRQEELARQRMERAAEAARQSLRETVYFDYDESAIRSDTEQRLRAKLDILRNNPGVQLRLEGHADERGTSEYNIALGNERAESVMQFFTGFGLDANRFSSVSYGEERPAAQGSTEAAWAQNRRVEFVVTAGGDDIGR